MLSVTDVFCGNEIAVILIKLIHGINLLIPSGIVAATVSEKILHKLMIVNANLLLVCVSFTIIGQP